MSRTDRPIAGSTPAMIENEFASGMRAGATTSPARSSVRQTFGSEIQSGPRPRRGGSRGSRRRPRS